MYLCAICLKKIKLVDIWRSSGKNNFAQFFLRHGVFIHVGYTIRSTAIVITILIQSKNRCIKINYYCDECGKIPKVSRERYNAERRLLRRHRVVSLIVRRFIVLRTRASVPVKTLNSFADTVEYLLHRRAVVSLLRQRSVKSKKQS